MKRLKKFFNKFNFEDFLPQLFSMLQVVIETPNFAKENKLWNGFFEHRWLGLMMLSISVLFSWYFIDDLWKHLIAFDLRGTFTNTFSTEMGLVSDMIDDEGKHTMLSGGTKYLLLILLEVIIFHFCIKTLSILTKKSDEVSFKKFYKAEIRMIKIMGWNFGKGIAAQVVISILLGFLDLDFLEPLLMFLVYTYFIGYAFLDNYNEQFEFKISKSQQIIRRHLGAAFALGLVVTLLLYIPLVGPLLAPIFGGVAATIYGVRYSMEDTELDLAVA
ncbi:MAG: EI24 domain-containing protein [Saprospiraceae bacterium]